MNNGSFIPPWGHLLFKPEELKQHLLAVPGIGSERLVNGIVNFIYNQKNINRASLKTYLDNLLQQAWTFLPESNNCETAPRVWKSFDDVQQIVQPTLTLQTLKKLQALYSPEERFDVGPCIFAAQKI